MQSPPRVEPLAASHLASWAALFDAASSPCHCRYWHFEGTRNEWLARCALSPEDNAREQAAAVAVGEPSAEGLVALVSGAVVGWMKLAPRAALPKLRRLGPYRALDLGDDAGVFAIGCFLVHPAYRHRGVARALLEAAPRYVEARGGRVIEAFPRHTGDPTHDEELLMGPEALFVEAGFIRVAGEGQYPVYRRAAAP